MRRQTLVELLPVIQAFVDGVPIQGRTAGYNGDWISTNNDPQFWNSSFEFRIEPTPPREWWINVYPKGMPCAHRSKEAAERVALPACLETVHVIEVKDDQ